MTGPERHGTGDRSDESDGAATTAGSGHARRTRTRREMLLAGGTVAAASIGGCLNVSGSSTSTVTFGTLPIATVAPVLIAEEKGYFEERNIEIERTRIGGVPLATPKLAAGEIDVAAGSIGAPVYNSIAQGVEINIAADMAQHYRGVPGGARVWARKDLYAEDTEFPDLVDKVEGPVTVAHNAKGGSLDVVLGRMLDVYGMSWDDVEVTEIGFSNMVPAMLSGDTDVCIAPDPLGLALANKANAGQLAYASALLPRMQIAAYFFGGPFVEDRSDVAVEWIEALLLGIREYYDLGAYPDDTVANLVNEAFEIPVPAIKSSVPALPHKNGTVNMDSVMRQQSYHACRGYVDETVDRDAIRNTELWNKALDTVGRLDAGAATPSPNLIQQWSKKAPRPYAPMGEVYPVEEFPDDAVCK